MLIERGVERLPPVPAAERERLAGLAGDRQVHDEAVRGLEALHAVEVVEPPVARPAAGRLRVAAWNVERGRRPEAIAPALAGAGVDVALLTELDVGMARSGQRHTPAAIAGALGHGYAFGVEYVELGLGSRDEQERLAGQRNDGGLHGAAVLTAFELRRPVLIRLEMDGDWFAEEWRGEPRVGGRIAVAATVPLGDDELVVVAVHLESHGDPAGRAGQFERLLDAVATYAGDRPVVIGGDLNTFSAAGVEIYSSKLRRQLATGDPNRFDDPVPYEPLFDLAAGRGYRWEEANVPGPTQRTGPSGSPRPPLMRLDWILVRGDGVEVSDPATVPAVGPGGEVLSDHDLVAVTVAAAR